MQSVNVKLNNVETNLLTWEWEDLFDSKNSDVIICVTGNPGIPQFYEEFASELNKNTGLPVCVIGPYFIRGDLWSYCKPKTKHTNMDSDNFLDRITTMGCDKMQPRYIFKRNFKIQVPTRAEWAEGREPPKEDGQDSIWYTDGSKMGSGQAGHVEVPEEKSNMLEQQEHLFGLEGQVQHKLDLVNKIDKRRKIHFIGHSIGAWLVLEAIKKQEDLMERVSSINLLFPTIQKIAESPNGKYLYGIVRRLHRMVILLFTLVYILPNTLKQFLASLYLKWNSLPQHYNEKILKYLRPKVIEKVLYMAYDAMDKVVTLDRETLARGKHLTSVVYSDRDDWAPIHYMKDFCSLQPELQMKQVSVDHAFVLTSAERVAELVVDFIKPKILIKKS